MNNISDILKSKQIAISDKPIKINLKYELAKEIGEYTGINVFVVMRLINKYGESEVRKLSSFLKDYPNLDKKRAIGLAHWYLKNRKNT